eukprot:1181932-Amphidinium_carterae.1
MALHGKNSPSTNYDPVPGQSQSVQARTSCLSCSLMEASRSSKHNSVSRAGLGASLHRCRLLNPRCSSSLWCRFTINPVTVD